MTVRAVIGLRAAICIIVATQCLAPGQGAAEDVTTGGEVAWPSLEERALPSDANKSEPQKPAETVAETNTREAMCEIRTSCAFEVSPS